MRRAPTISLSSAMGTVCLGVLAMGGACTREIADSAAADTAPSGFDLAASVTNPGPHGVGYAVSELSYPDPAGDGERSLYLATWYPSTDATAGAFVEIKREKEALEDRLLCTICMEADAPRTVLFGPCNHFLACASCAAALQECPNCRATITTRTTIANSS